MFHTVRRHSLLEEKAWTQEPEAAGHFAPTVKKQRVINIFIYAV